MNWRSLFYVILAVALLGGLGYWFVNNFERVTIESAAGFKGEARSNPLFAARLYLKRMGIPAQRYDGLTTLPPTDTVILLNTERFTLTTARAEALLDWVGRGGHLITRARVDADSIWELNTDAGPPRTEHQDFLQQRLGVRIGAHQMPAYEALPVAVRLPQSRETLAIQLDFFNALELTAGEADEYQLDGHTWLAQIPHGKGLVSMAATLEFIENPQLEEADHAKFLWYLLRSGEPDFQRVWLIHQDSYPALGVLLIRHATPLLVMLVLGLILAFWHGMPRFGAIISAPLPERRRILDHIQASAQLLWKQKAHDHHPLVHTMRNSVQDYGTKHIPGWNLMDLSRQLVALQEAAGWPASQQSHLKHLLFAPNLDDQDFTRLVQFSQQLRATKD